MEEMLLIDKPVGVSSAEIVRLLKPAFPGEKIGHGGTLDPLANGLLIVLVGKATKLFSQLQEYPKTYLAEITFGKTTTTLDREGEVTLINPSELIGEKFSRSALDRVLASFSSRYRQRVPAFSAVKYKGKPFYWWRRHYPQQPLPVKKKEVNFYDWQVISLKESPYPAVTLRLKVSSGFYVRQFASDLGEKLELAAYLSSLRRLAIGEYSLED